MTTPINNSKCVHVIVHLRDKSTKTLTENVTCGSGDKNELKSLSESLLSMQEKVNTFLTKLVEEERGTTLSTGNVNNAADSEEDDEDDDEDDDKTSEEPPAKQQKT